MFVCRPNNPTGELPDIPDVAGQLVIDEAYADYAGVDALERVNDGAIVLRTFSKAYGLAGARVGYAIASPDTIDIISSRQAPLSVSSLSAALALAAIATPLDVTAQVAERERLSGELSSLGLTPVKSYTNFLFIPMDGTASARRAVDDLRRGRSSLRGGPANQREGRTRRQRLVGRTSLRAKRRRPAGDPRSGVDARRPRRSSTCACAFAARVAST